METLESQIEKLKMNRKVSLFWSCGSVKYYQESKHGYCKVLSACAVTQGKQSIMKAIFSSRFKSVSHWLLQLQSWRYHLCLCTVRAQSASIPQLNTATDHKQEPIIPFWELFRITSVKLSSMNTMLSLKKDALLSGKIKVLLMHYWTWVISWRNCFRATNFHHLL